MRLSILCIDLFLIQAAAFVVQRNVPFTKCLNTRKPTALIMDAVESPVLQRHCFPLNTISINEVPKFGG